MRRTAIGLCTLLLLLSTATTALAQFETASVVGTLRDPSGGIVPGAKVTLTSRETGVSITRTSDAQGNYEFVTVKPGGYVVSAEKEGFAIVLADSVVVNVGARLRLDLAMKVGALTEKVEVKGQ